MTPPRAPRLSARERRSALVDATLPLLLEHGRTVTTRQIAEAAGVAEGTIFRHYDSKHDLIGDALGRAFDVEPFLAELRAVAPDQPVRQLLVELVTRLQERFRGMFALMAAMGLTGPPEARRHGHRAREEAEQIMAGLLAPYAVEFTVPVEQVVHVVRLLTFSGSHPHLTHGRVLTPEQVVEAVYDGLHARRSSCMLIALVRTYLRPYRRWLAAVVALQFVSTVAMLYLPSLNADIIDRGIVLGDTGYIIQVGGIMLAVSLVGILGSIGAVWFSARSAMAFGRDVRAAIFRRVGSFSLREVQEFGAPSLITRETNDVQQVQMLVLLGCTMMVAAPLMMVGGVIMAMREDFGLSWLLVVTIPALGLAVALIVTRMVPSFRLMQERIDEVNRLLREQITGVRVVRAFVREAHETERFAQANRDLTEVSIRAGRWLAAMFPLVMLIVNAASVAVLWFGGHRVDSGEMEVGALTAFLTYLMQILMSVMMATFMFMMVPRSAVCAQRIMEVLDAETSVAPPDAPVSDLAGDGTLEFRGVELTYPGADVPVLRQVSFTARPGQTVAVIGSTGAGKSTLVNLVPRLFDVTDGQVLVDGIDVRDLEPEVLWSRLGLVPQRAYLFSGTVRSNLLHGKADATDEELWEALRIAQADDFVRAMPDGLDAPIAQGGTNVSGGQRQRLAIARAVVRRPAIYLFDDAFSALDLATDARLRSALRPVTADATVVLVAQRVSTLRNADQILVLEDGLVVGHGTHDALLESCAEYREIVASQLGAEEVA